MHPYTPVKATVQDRETGQAPKSYRLRSEYDLIVLLHVFAWIDEEGASNIGAVRAVPAG